MRKSLALYLGVTRFENLIAAIAPPQDDVVLVQRAILEGNRDVMRSQWEATGARLRQIAAEAARRNIPVLLVSFPMENQVLQRKPSPAYGDALRDAWRTTGMPTIDLLPSYRDSLQTGRNPFLPYDLHPGPIGMELAADAIYGEIGRRGLLDFPPLDAPTR